jgi:putative transposase
VACDFFTAYTLWGRVVYVLFFIELSTRRVHLAGCTANPDSAWIVQQARNLCLSLDQRTEPLRFLIHDRDSKFSGAFDEVFSTEGIEIVKTPIHSPASQRDRRALDQDRASRMPRLAVDRRRSSPPQGPAYLRQSPQPAEAHRGLDLKAPETVPTWSTEVSRCSSIRRRDRLGGLIHEYQVAA